MGTTGRLSAPTSLPVIFFLLLFLPMPNLLPGLVWAEGPVAKSCPLAAHDYQAQLIRSQLTGTVGETIIISFSLNPPEPPQGFFLSVNMKALDEPDAARSRTPEILSGFPETTAVFSTPGIYKYTVVVSLIAKSSCGGVKADTILNGEVLIDVKP
jgi:hypothetical protein